MVGGGLNPNPPVIVTAAVGVVLCAYCYSSTPRANNTTGAFIITTHSHQQAKQMHNNNRQDEVCWRVSKLASTSTVY